MDTLLSLSNDLAGAVERTAPAIVTVHARRRLPSTGIHWRPGVIVTADHTVRAEEDITVTTPDGRALPAVLAGRDPGTDLAVLTVKDAGSATAALGDDAALKVGHLVLALGYGPRVSWGVIGALGPRWRSWRGGEIDQLVRLDLTLYPGFSGGPLVDAGGRVVGLNTSGLARDARLTVPATTVTRVTDELLRTGHVSRGYLGLGMQPVPLPAQPSPSVNMQAQLSAPTDSCRCRKGTRRTRMRARRPAREAVHRRPAASARIRIRRSGMHPAFPRSMRRSPCRAPGAGRPNRRQAPRATPSRRNSCVRTAPRRASHGPRRHPPLCPCA